MSKQCRARVGMRRSRRGLASCTESVRPSLSSSQLPRPEFQLVIRVRHVLSLARVGTHPPRKACILSVFEVNARVKLVDPADRVDILRRSEPIVG